MALLNAITIWYGIAGYIIWSRHCWMTSLFDMVSLDTSSDQGIAERHHSLIRYRWIHHLIKALLNDITIWYGIAGYIIWSRHCWTTSVFDMVSLRTSDHGLADRHDSILVSLNHYAVWFWYCWATSVDHGIAEYITVWSRHCWTTSLFKHGIAEWHYLIMAWLTNIIELLFRWITLLSNINWSWYHWKNRSICDHCFSHRHLSHHGIVEQHSYPMMALTEHHHLTIISLNSITLWRC